MLTKYILKYNGSNSLRLLSSSRNHSEQCLWFMSGYFLCGNLCTPNSAILKIYISLNSLPSEARQWNGKDDEEMPILFPSFLSFLSFFLSFFLRFLPSFLFHMVHFFRTGLSVSVPILSDKENPDPASSLTKWRCLPLIWRYYEIGSNEKKSWLTFFNLIGMMRLSLMANLRGRFLPL